MYLDQKWRFIQSTVRQENRRRVKQLSVECWDGADKAPSHIGACSMKLPVKDLANLLALVVVVTSTTVAQTGSKTLPSVEGKTDVESTAGEMRVQQLRIFREHVFARVLDNIKKMDEAGLRISARNEILSYLANNKALSDDRAALATQIARDALIDLSEHHEEIDSFMLGYLSNNLGSWIQKYRPNLIEDFDKTVAANVKVNAAQRIRSLFALEGGDLLAAKRIRQELENQASLDGLYFWLDELMRRNSREFEPVALDVVARAGQGQISFDTLFWISEIYLRPQVSNALRNRFLTVVIARTQPANFVTRPAPQLAHVLLTKLLPVIQQSIPELYDQAQNHHFAMRASLNEKQLAADARIKRLKESLDPIGDLKSEAESAKTKIERNDLLLQAAELALERKEFQLCLDILDDLDLAATDPIWQITTDQILTNLVRAGLTDKSADLAEKGAARIGAILIKVQSLTMIMRHYTKANDKEAAQRLLIEASKVAASSPDTNDKAKAFFLLSVSCNQVDSSRKADLLLSGIKALNNLSKPDATVKDRTAYQSYVQRLDNSGYELTKGFKGLTKQDENGAMALVERLQKPDLRTFALIGILLGLDELLTARPPI
jgi:hypothetical protein